MSSDFLSSTSRVQLRNQPKFISFSTAIFRGDAHLNNLRSSAYEAVMELVKNSPKDVYPTIQKTILSILAKIDAILKMEESGSHVGDHSQHNDFKSLLCATLQVNLNKSNMLNHVIFSEKRERIYFGGLQKQLFVFVGV